MDEDLASLSHVALAPTACRLAPAYAEVATKQYRAVGRRILAATKHKYADAVVSHCAQVKQGHEWAGLEHEWRTLVASVLRLHGRKYSFIPGFDQEVSGDPGHGKPRF